MAPFVFVGLGSQKGQERAIPRGHLDNAERGFSEQEKIFAIQIKSDPEPGGLERCLVIRADAETTIMSLRLSDDSVLQVEGSYFLLQDQAPLEIRAVEDGPVVERIEHRNHGR